MHWRGSLVLVSCTVATLASVASAQTGTIEEALACERQAAALSLADPP